MLTAQNILDFIDEKWPQTTTTYVSPGLVEKIFPSYGASFLRRIVDDRIVIVSTSEGELFRIAIGSSYIVRAPGFLCCGVYECQSDNKVLHLITRILDNPVLGEDDEEIMEALLAEANRLLYQPQINVIENEYPAFVLRSRRHGKQRWVVHEGGNESNSHVLPSIFKRSLATPEAVYHMRTVNQRSR